MEELRNITREAIILAERDQISFIPELAKKEYRVGLDPIDRAQIFMNLVSSGEYYEEVLIAQLRN